MAYLLWHYLRDSAALQPDRPAVQSEGMVLTYGELDDSSSRLATALTACGLQPGDRFGMYMPKTARSVAVTQGVSKAGGAYVPIDPNAPAARAAYILGNCAVKGLAITSRKLSQLSEFLRDIPSLEVVLVIDDAPQATAPAGVRLLSWSDAMNTLSLPPAGDVAIEDDPAYLLYTSGSTGSPKGVIISHRNAMAFVDWAAETFNVRAEDRLSNHAPLHFDLSVLDIYAALRSGACVVVVPEGLSSFPVELAAWIEREQISIWYSVPSALTRLLLHGQLDRFEYQRLRCVLFAGEVFPVKYLREVMTHLSHADFYNLYGPTETNVCTYYPVPRELPTDSDISIGMSCRNTHTFAITDSGTVAGVGEEGELFVRGPTVMLGYWGLPEKTDEMLSTNPAQKAYREPVYRTGDLVRVEPDGNYRFLGRRDHMVKSRGYRIELGEIEQTIYRDERIKEAVVVAIPDDEIGSRLKAVVVVHAGHTVTRAELQGFCLKHLPRYMVPEDFIFEDELPRTSTGKADRQAVRHRVLDVMRTVQAS
jgi:amino acid adenylation domain-containing protein